MLDKIVSVDESFSRWLRSFNIASSVKFFLRLYTRFGDGFYWFGVAIALMIFADDGVKIITYGLIGEMFSLIFYWSLKLGLKRRRPYHVYDDIEMGIAPLDRYSFPSGHTMNNLAPAIIVASFFAPWVAFVVILIPLSWGLLRIYFGVHFISDIIAGFVLGCLSAFLGIILASSINWPWL